MKFNTPQGPGQTRFLKKKKKQENENQIARVKCKWINRMFFALANCFYTIKIIGRYLDPDGRKFKNQKKKKK